MTATSVALRVGSDVSEAGRTAFTAALTLGFDALAAEELRLVAHELASNVVRHAHGGTLGVSAIDREGHLGIELCADDDGPGIANAELALADGFSTAGSLGTGLGTVNRLADELDISAGETGRGARVVCRRWLREPASGADRLPLAFGVATRAQQVGGPNGDAYVIRKRGGAALVGVIDGVGHGVEAYRAAQMAVDYVNRHDDRPLDELMRGTSRACRGTRGVVMALARIEADASRLTFASVGNIEARLNTPSEHRHLIAQRGLLGLHDAHGAVTEHPWVARSMLVLHSDGAKAHWAWSDFSDLWPEPPEKIARRLLGRLTVGHTDDATVLVVGDARR